MWSSTSQIEQQNSTYNANKTLIPTTLLQDLARKALIWASLPGVLYREELYTPDSSAVQLP
jgi:hypothetical protein